MRASVTKTGFSVRITSITGLFTIQITNCTNTASYFVLVSTIIRIELDNKNKVQYSAVQIQEEIPNRGEC